MKTLSFASLSKGYASYKNSFRSAVQYIIFAKALEIKQITEVPKKTADNTSVIAALRKDNAAAKRSNEIREIATFIADALDINENSLKRKNAPILLEKIKNLQTCVTPDGVGVKLVKLPKRYAVLADYAKLRIVTPATWLEQLYTAACNITDGVCEKKTFEVTALAKCHDDANVEEVTGDLLFVEGDKCVNACDATRAKVDELTLIFYAAARTGAEASAEFLAHELTKR